MGSSCLLCGPPSHTGAPGEANCTACHTSFPVNSGTGGVTITGLPANYRPGQVVPITVTVSQDGNTATVAVKCSTAKIKDTVIKARADAIARLALIENALNS